MATVAIAFHKPMQGVSPVLGAIPSTAEEITSSGTSQATTAAASNGDVINVTSSGGAVWVNIGTTPTASSGTDWLIPDGGSKDFSAFPGAKVAVIDA